MLLHNISQHAGRHASLLKDFDAVWLVGQKDKAVHAGLEASGVGNIRLCAARLIPASFQCRPHKP